MFKIALALTLLAAHAAPLNSAEDFFKESQAAFEKASKETTFEKKGTALKALEKSFEATLNQYEKSNPTEGDDKEQDVARLFYTLEPAFELAKLKDKTKKDCARKKQDVMTGDNQAEDAPASPNAKEALRWIELLCK
ncbi:hypothetical protein AB1A81_08355 [Bdellovibrio bacteriovorus]|uniref:Uncharacterized protein n=1 Tax=Bdellovibrio bacteriovorus (strain ATCC 15356 / DSM 50701 / NCIMB 9529 / HD100) TaxID=264462 RepID=Q6MM19_BDEBA|nr:hypothetical protein [Bdellovibrio bacteriovorus]CAE79687.1 hypothetical protein predicted by Glimmer/Critica [Bdellovibrio bacteriovorus HD100]